jgi:hypothetical protein
MAMPLSHGNTGATSKSLMADNERRQNALDKHSDSKNLVDLLLVM